MDEAALREKEDHELIELLNEVRVALSGASVLFGFLLIVPFSARWERTTEVQRGAYVVAFLATLLAVLALMIPTASGARSGCSASPTSARSAASCVSRSR